MTTIPETLSKIAPILCLYWHVLLSAISQALFDRLVSQAHRHPLVQLQALLDFQPIEDACQAYHLHNGLGPPVIHSVLRLVRILFLKYYGNHSLRELETCLEYNLLYRWFAGYGLFDKTADRSTIHTFESYVREKHPRLYFDTVLRQLDEVYPKQRECVQIGDTFALKADAAREPLLPRLRHLMDRLLRAFLKADPDGYHQLAPRLDWTGLQGASDEPHYSRLTDEQKVERLHRTVLSISLALSCLPADLPPSVMLWMSYLNKVLADEIKEYVDEQTGEIRYLQRKGKERGSYRLVSATDPEATIRNHGADKTDGYNVSIATTTNFIREISVATGCEPDAQGIPRLLQAQIDSHQLYPEKLVYDRAAGWGKYFHIVETLSGGRTQLVARIVERERTRGTFGPMDFNLSEDELVLTCPNGRSTTLRYPKPNADGFTFHFSPGQCRGCPLLKACRGSEEYPTKRRTVFISSYKQALLMANAYNQTPAFRADLKLRPQVERIIAGLVRYNGARRARFRGLKKVDFQMKMCAMAYNVKRWIQKRKRKKPPNVPREECV